MSHRIEEDSDSSSSSQRDDDLLRQPPQSYTFNARQEHTYRKLETFFDPTKIDTLASLRTQQNKRIRPKIKTIFAKEQYEEKEVFELVKADTMFVDSFNDDDDDIEHDNQAFSEKIKEIQEKLKAGEHVAIDTVIRAAAATRLGIPDVRHIWKERDRIVFDQIETCFIPKNPKIGKSKRLFRHALFALIVMNNNVGVKRISEIFEDEELIEWSEQQIFHVLHCDMHRLDITPEDFEGNEDKLKQWIESGVEDRKDVEEYHREKARASMNQKRRNSIRKRKKKTSFWACCGKAQKDDENNVPEINSQPIDIERGFAGEIDVLSGLQTIILLLLDYLNPDINIHRKTMVSCPRKVIWCLDEAGKDIVRDYCTIWMIPNYYSKLAYLELLTKNVSFFVVYFEEARDIVEELIKSLENGEPWRQHDIQSFDIFVNGLINWCRLCISNYQNVFVEDIDQDPRNSLRFCLELLNLCVDFHCKFHNAEPLDWNEYIEKLCDEAIAKRYSQLVTWVTHKYDEEEQSDGDNQSEDCKIDLVEPHEVLEERKKSERRKFSGFGKLFNKNDVAKDIQTLRRLKTFNLTMALNEEMMEFCNVRSKMQMIKLIDLVGIEMDDDIDFRNFVFEDEVPGFEFSKNTAESYFPLLWSDFQLLLRYQSEELAPQKSIKMNIIVFILYGKLRNFYERVSNYIELPELELQSWFTTFVDQWLEFQRSQFLDSKHGLLKKIFANDAVVEAEKVSSSSVYDLFRMLYPFVSVFDMAPYGPQQALSMSRILSDIATEYSTKVYKRLASNLSAKNDLGWGLLETKEGFEICIDSARVAEINNLFICRENLRALIVDCDLENAYERVTSLKSENNSSQSLECMDSINDPLHLAIIDELSCVHAFHYIDESLTEIGKLLANKMGIFWESLIGRFIWEKQPLDELFTLDEVEDILAPLWNSMIAFFRYYDETLISIDFILRSCLDRITKILEQHLKAEEVKIVLTRSQVERVSQILALVKELFEYSGLEAQFINDHTIVQRVTYLISFLKTPTEMLLEMSESGLFMDQWSDEEAPYLSKLHFMALMQYRSKYEYDSFAKKFVKHDKKFSLSSSNFMRKFL